MDCSFRDWLDAHWSYIQDVNKRDGADDLWREIRASLSDQDPSLSDWRRSCGDLGESTGIPGLVAYCWTCVTLLKGPDRPSPDAFRDFIDSFL
jgi:hypothetical protein